MKDHDDELMDVLLGSTAGPLSEEVDRMIQTLSIDVPESEVEAAARAVAARISPARSRVPWVLAATAVLALSAWAAWTALQPPPPPEAPPEPAPEQAPASTPPAAPTAVPGDEDIAPSAKAQASDCFAVHARYREEPGNEALYRETRACYEGFFARHPGSAHEHVARYGYAEFLYTAGEFEAAFDAYGRCVDSDPDGKHARFCASSRIYAATRVNDTTPGFGEWEAKLVEAADALTARWPEDAAAPGARYSAAFAYYEHGRYAEAAPRLEAVIAEDPAPDRRELAANLLLDIDIREGDWAGVVARCEALLAMDDAFSEAFEAQLAEIRDKAAAELE